MFWADKLLQGRSKKEWINDAWTPSGMIHMGGLKGPVIHDVLYRIVKEQGREVTFTFGFDDMDPIDGLPADLRSSHEQSMGIPICIAPSPDGKGSFGDYFSNKMRVLFKALGIGAEIYVAHEYYKKGVYNKALTYVLDHAQEIRNVYSVIYQKPIASDWFPLQVICPECGKLGTTKVTAWDGKEVTFTCEPSLVQWAKGCGYSGKISPFDGNGKMPFKVEWAAKWWTFGVTIEAAGKDHASAGGTYDVAMKICRDVFKKEPPLKIPYEFFLSGGKKMSSSKGVGLNGEDLLEVLGPERVRFLMIKTPPNQAVEFTPYDSLGIPKVFDEYQAAAFSEDESAKRLFALSQLQEGKAEKVPTIRFTTLAQWVQMPNMDETIHKEGLTEWAKYARIWIEKYAPESEKFVIQKEIPASAVALTKEQKLFLGKVGEALAKTWDAEQLQKEMYEWGKAMDVNSKDAFSAIYTALLGKNHGPKAAWLILSLDKGFVQKRFQEISQHTA